jgi:hypothetical protein
MLLFLQTTAMNQLSKDGMTQKKQGRANAVWQDPA